jgi:S1-C subfamily serine protease
MKKSHSVLALFVSLGIFIMLNGCVSSPETPSSVDPSQAVAGRIGQLAETDPEQNIAILSDVFERQREKGEPLGNSVIGEQALALFRTSADNIVTLFKKAIQENDLIAARRLSFSVSSIIRYASLYDSLEKMLPREFSAIGAPAMRLQLAFLEAEEKFQKHGYVAGKTSLSAALMAEPGLSSLSAATNSIENLKSVINTKEPLSYYRSWAERAKENQDSDAEAWFSALASNKDLGSNSVHVPSDDWLSGAVASVVTVYVDRGFKIQSGYSVPDRVLGTAFQISKGLYLTNYHVIQSEVDPTYKGYSRISIRPSENPQIKVPAKVIGWDEEMDLALIRSEETAQGTIFLPATMQFQAGDRVFAVGSPVGLENSVTAGVVSSLSRKIISYGEAAQIDVPVNEGNSGSPLFSANGVLVGMVFAGLPSFQNINFALPAQWLVASLPALFDGKAAIHARLGLMLGKGSGQNPLVLADLDSSLSAFRAGDVLTMINDGLSKDIASIQLQLAAIPKDALCYVEAQRNFQPIRRLRRICFTDDASLIPAWDSIQKNTILEGLLGAKLTQLENSNKVGGLYSVQWVCPAEAADEIGLSENDTIKINKFQLDRKNKMFILEFSAKSRLSGYFERTIRLEFSSDSATII